ncbi:hypothetical protein BH23BAC3_BH23BAC3_08030 [soil metagenome]
MTVTNERPGTDDRRPESGRLTDSSDDCLFRLTSHQRLKSCYINSNPLIAKFLAIQYRKSISFRGTYSTVEKNNRQSRDMHRDSASSSLRSQSCRSPSVVRLRSSFPVVRLRSPGQRPAVVRLRSCLATLPAALCVRSLAGRCQSPAHSPIINSGLCKSSLLYFSGDFALPFFPEYRNTASAAAVSHSMVGPKRG